MGRYTLKVNIPGKGIFDVLVPEAGIKKLKVNLQAIDSFTIGSNPNMIFKDLDFSQAIVYNPNNIYVSYISKQEEKRLQVMFNDAHQLKKLASESSKGINPQNRVFNSFIDETFLPMIKNPKVYNFLRRHNLIGYKLNEWIANYHTAEYNLEFCIQKIKEYASEYKQFRALVLGIELYKDSKFLEPLNQENADIDDDMKEYMETEKPFYKKYVLSRIGDSDSDPDKMFGLWSEGELRRYDEYLNNLPDEDNPDDKHL